jgi:glycolate oxidase FAD binding subunit
MPDQDLSALLSEQVRTAPARQARLAISAGASKPWFAAGDREVLSVAGHSGIVSYHPTELVVTVRAGTPLADLDAALAEQGQMLAAECPDFPGGSTVGGAMALGWCGSRAPYAGSLRDLVLGCRMLNGLGESLRFGGQVMKNVAGYDIPRLLSGSQGRLGVILELSLKLQPLPQRELSLEFGFDTLAQSREFVRNLLRAGEPLSATSYAEGRLRLRFSGHHATLAELAARLPGREIDNEFWCQLRGMRLPLFTNAENSAELYDWNGDLCWSREAGGALWRQEGDGAAVNLDTGPADPVAGSGALAELQRRLVLAFDPEGVFAQSPPGEA